MPPSNPRKQLQPLTSLRFLAAIYVVVYHYWTSYHLSEARPLLVELGQTGVTFFFLLSGFILSYSYDDNGRFPEGKTRRFYLARLARIYPVYIVTILIMFPGLVLLKNSGVADQHYRELWAIASPFALHAWIPGAACSLNCPNWSISTEAFFYLLFPFVFAPVYRRPVLAIVLACAAMISIWTIQADIWTSSGRELADMETTTFASDPRGEWLNQLFLYFPLTRVPEFFAGIGLYGLWRRGADRISPALLYAIAALGAAVVVVSAEDLPHNVLATGFAVICYAPVILAAANTRAGILVQPAFIWLGQISFALYLVHSPVDSYLRTIDKIALGSKLAAMPLAFFALATAASLIAAAMLFHFVEEPARKARLRARYSPASIDKPTVQNAEETRSLKPAFGARQ
jgi:peptidoglycan/LPS O-acetylase OafA/YrhL